LATSWAGNKAPNGACNRSLRIRTLMAISRRLMGDNKRSFAGSSRADLAAELSFGRSVKNQSKCPFGKPHLSGGPPRG